MTAELQAKIDTLEAEVARLREERDQLFNYVRGLIGLTQLIRGRDDVPAEVKESLRTNHRVTDAGAYLTQIVKPEDSPAHVSHLQAGEDVK